MILIWGIGLRSVAEKYFPHSGLSTQEFLANINVLLVLAPELPYSTDLTLTRVTLIYPLNYIIPEVPQILKGATHESNVLSDHP
jgi:hypothetical protein